MKIFHRTQRTLVTLAITLAMVFALSGQVLAAPNYSCGTYGSGGYNANCPDTTSSSSSSSSSGGQTATVEEGQKIILNDFQEYLSSVGKDLEMNTGDQVFFKVLVGGSDEEHSVTIKEVGTNYVIVTFASTPVDVKIFIGETVEQDVTGDNESDIEVKLNSILDGVANLTFRQFVAQADPIPERTDTPKTTDDAEPSSSSTGWWLVGLALLVFGLILWFLLSRRRQNESTPGPH